MLARGERFATVPYAAFADASRPWPAARRASRRPTSAGTRRPSTSSPSARCPAARPRRPLAASLARYRAELEAARAWLDGYRARLDSVDRRLADRAAPLLQ